MEYVNVSLLWQWKIFNNINKNLIEIISIYIFEHDSSSLGEMFLPYSS
jgi:hypothetical protein